MGLSAVAVPESIIRSIQGRSSRPQMNFVILSQYGGHRTSHYHI